MAAAKIRSRSVVLFVSTDDRSRRRSGRTETERRLELSGDGVGFLFDDYN